MQKKKGVRCNLEQIHGGVARVWKKAEPKIKKKSNRRKKPEPKIKCQTEKKKKTESGCCRRHQLLACVVFGACVVPSSTSGETVRELALVRGAVIASACCLLLVLLTLVRAARARAGVRMLLIPF